MGEGCIFTGEVKPSMKVPPKRKGNSLSTVSRTKSLLTLNESPSEKEGKFQSYKRESQAQALPSMKVPPKRKGNWSQNLRSREALKPSMKVPPKRKGNLVAGMRYAKARYGPQ